MLNEATTLKLIGIVV